MAAATLGSAIVEIGADIAKLKTGVNQANSVLGSMAKTAQGVSSAITGLFAGIGISALTAAARGALSFAASLGETADAIGLTVERFQKLRFAAQQSGVSAEQFTVGMGNLARKAGEAGITTERAFDLVVAKMAKAESQSQRVAIAMGAFGDAGRQMALAFGDGGAAAEEMGRKLQAMGGVLSKEVTRKVAEANDQIDAFIGLIQVALVRAIGEAISALQLLNTAIGYTAQTLGLGVQTLGKKLQQLFELAKQSIPDYADKEGSRARVDQLKQEEEALISLQRALTAVAKGEPLDASKLINVQPFDASKLINVPRSVKDLGPLLPNEEDFFRKLGQMSGSSTTSGRGAGGGTAREQSLKRTNALIEEENARLERNRALWEEVLSPAEKVNREWAKLDELLAKGEIDWELYARATLKASDQMDEISVKAAEATSWAREMGLTFQSAFEDAILSGKALSDVIQALGRDIAAVILRKAVTEPLGSFVSAWASQAFGGTLGKLFGAQHGADFLVGGPGGVDSQVVAFRATPGERVTVTPSGRQVAGTDRNVSVTINVMGGDADSFRRSRSQVVAEYRRALAGVKA